MGKKERERVVLSPFYKGCVVCTDTHATRPFRFQRHESAIGPRK